MPVTIQPASLKYKNSNGEFQSADCLKGNPGYSPTAIVNKTGNTTTITITDENGTTSATVNDGSDYILTQQDKEDIAAEIDAPVTDVQLNSSSIVNNGIANIPVASDEAFGLIKTSYTSGTIIGSDGSLTIKRAATEYDCKNGNDGYRFIPTYVQHLSTFWGLAKAAGDTTQAQSANTVGNYTDTAKEKIQSMLGISQMIATENPNMVAAQAYSIGDIFTANGKLYKATAAIAADAAIIIDGANANCIEYNISDNLSDKVAKTEIDYAGISQYTYSTKFGGEFSVTTATTSGYSSPYARATVTGIPSKHKLHRVTVNGIEYILSPKLWFKTTATDFKVYTYLGKLSLYVSSTTGVPGTIDDVPFLIFFDINEQSSIDIITQTAGTYTIKIEEMTPIQKELPKSLIYGDNYIPIEKNNNSGTYNGFSIGVNELKNTRGTIALGYTNLLSNEFTKALGEANKITGKYGIAIGISNTVSGTQSVAIGTRNIASNDFAFAEGADTTASGSYSHSEGFETLASGVTSHAEGYGSIAEAEGAHAEGVYSIASGSSSHAEGAYGTASGRASHTEGEGNTAAGASSHAEGLLTIANGAGTHVSGFYNQADTVYDTWTANTSYDVGDKVVYRNYGYECITANSDTTWTAAHWKDNLHSSDKAIIVGNGTSHSQRANAFALTWTGDGKYAGDLYVHANADSSGGSKVATIGDISVSDVQVNSGSIVSNGVANIPVASENTLGVVKIPPNFGIGILNGFLYIKNANAEQTKAGTHTTNPIVPSIQHSSVFYGLAKAAGDTTQSLSDNAVGVYTDNAKVAIRAMLGAGTYSKPVNGIPASDLASGVVPVQDVQVNGTSILANGVANVPVASVYTLGAVQVSPTFGLQMNAAAGYKQYITTNPANSSTIKNPDTGNFSTYRPIAPRWQHESTFYGLAKAAGDTTQSASSNAVGTYTDEAKSAIQTMLGIDLSSIASQVEIPLVETVTGAAVTITGQPNTRYMCGEVTSISITPPAAGSIDIIFTSGSTVAVLTLPSTVKMPEWFDATTLDANTVYEILITDGVYGSVMTWAT